MSPATGQRIVAALVLKPQRLPYFLPRPDPCFEEKLAEMLALYLPPPRRGRMLCLDVSFRGASLTSFTEGRFAHLAPSTLQVRADQFRAFSSVP